MSFKDNLLPPTGKCSIVIGGKACQSRPLPRQLKSEKQQQLGFSRVGRAEESWSWSSARRWNYQQLISHTRVHVRSAFSDRSQVESPVGLGLQVNTGISTQTEQTDDYSSRYDSWMSTNDRVQKPSSVWIRSEPLRAAARDPNRHQERAVHRPLWRHPRQRAGQVRDEAHLCLSVFVWRTCL